MHCPLFLVFAQAVLSTASDVCLVYTPGMAPDAIPVAVDCTRAALRRRDDGGRVIQGNDSRVKWTLVCDPLTQPCDKVEHALLLMATNLENVIYLNEIHIHITYDSFCKTTFGCGSSVAGFCKPSQLISVNEEGVSVMYPQALFKQKPRQETVQLEPYDMYVNINSLKNFHFPMDYPSSIGLFQVSFIDVLVHEVNHGLGFFGSLFERKPRLVTPTPRVWTSTTPTGKETNIKFYFTAYDKRIYTKSQKTSFVAYAKALESLDAKGVSYDDLMANIEAYPHYPIFRNLSKVVDKDQDLYFHTQINVNATLESSLFRKGGDLSHLDSETYKGTRDAVMRPKVSTWAGIHDVYDYHDLWIRAPYGEVTLQILSTLGYRLSSGPYHEASLEGYFMQHFGEAVFSKMKHLFVPNKLELMRL